MHVIYENIHKMVSCCEGGTQGWQEEDVFESEEGVTPAASDAGGGRTIHTRPTHTQARWHYIGSEIHHLLVSAAPSAVSCPTRHVASRAHG